MSHEAGAFEGVAEVGYDFLKVGGVTDRVFDGVAADGSGVGGCGDERQCADVGGRGVCEREPGRVAVPVRAAGRHGDVEVVAEAEARRAFGGRGVVAGPGVCRRCRGARVADLSGTAERLQLANTRAAARVGLSRDTSCGGIGYLPG